MNKLNRLLATAAIVCCGALLPTISNATFIDLTVTKVVEGQDTGQEFGFTLFEPGFFTIDETDFELANGESAEFDPFLAFFVTETDGSDQLIDIDIQGSGNFLSIDWVGAANAPVLPDFLDFLGDVPDNGAGVLCKTFKGCEIDVTFTNLSQVPVPAAVWLFGSGLIGLAGIARRGKG